MKNHWIQNNSKFSQVGGDSDIIQTIPIGVYKVELTKFGFHLEYTDKSFTFTHKLYNLQTDFINHVLKAYNNTTGNFGVLLNGLKGSGKTVAAKIIANKLNLPVIIVKSFDERNSELMEFLSSFDFDCVLFFDEFEKSFDEEDDTILKLMDGVYSSIHRKVFLLTTNELEINENLLSRPSRIRYVYNFNHLEENVLNEVIDDLLIDKSCKEELLKYLDTLALSSIDILQTIIQEINIFGFKEFEKIKTFFNVEQGNYLYRIWRGVFEDSLEISTEYFAKLIENIIQNPKYEHQYNIRRYHVDYLKHSIKDLKAGDKFGVVASSYNGPIVQFDRTNKVIITYDCDNYLFYYIENIDEKPSIKSK